MRARSHSGFTLIELSIVLVIIGLLVGGLLVGRDLIKAAEIRSSLSQLEQFQSAVGAFRLKYNCRPGDCPNATTQYSFAPMTGWCNNFGSNGDGNGIIGPSDSYLFGTGQANQTEKMLFWWHLNQARLLAGIPPRRRATAIRITYARSSATTTGGPGICRVQQAGSRGALPRMLSSL
jgi:prepilin-type N-terminal cleavage/methylation domain-containing protein